MLVAVVVDVLWGVDFLAGAGPIEFRSPVPSMCVTVSLHGLACPTSRLGFTFRLTDSLRASRCSDSNSTQVVVDMLELDSPASKISTSHVSHMYS